VGSHYAFGSGVGWAQESEPGLDGGAVCAQTGGGANAQTSESQKSTRDVSEAYLTGVGNEEAGSTMIGSDLWDQHQSALAREYGRSQWPPSSSLVVQTPGTAVGKIPTGVLTLYDSKIPAGAGRAAATEK